MKKIRSIIKRILLIWGAISALGLIALIGLFVYSITIGNRELCDKASKEDVRSVLNWCDLEDERIEEVIKSYQSPRSFTLDHLDAYAIKVSHVSIDELQTDNWQRADQATGVYRSAIDFMSGWLDEISWFPGYDEIRSEKYYVYLWRIGFHGNSPDYASIILVRPEDNMVFYFDGSL